MKISVDGSVGEQTGWVIDYAEISDAFRPILDQLDHYYLNEIKGLENPTSENLAIWIYNHLKQSLAALSEVEVKETCTSGCIYSGT